MENCRLKDIPYCPETQKLIKILHPNNSAGFRDGKLNTLLSNSDYFRDAVTKLLNNSPETVNNPEVMKKIEAVEDLVIAEEIKQLCLNENYSMNQLSLSLSQATETKLISPRRIRFIQGRTHDITDARYTEALHAIAEESEDDAIGILKAIEMSKEEILALVARQHMDTISGLKKSFLQRLIEEWSLSGDDKEFVTDCLMYTNTAKAMALQTEIAFSKTGNRRFTEAEINTFVESVSEEIEIFSGGVCKPERIKAIVRSLAEEKLVCLRNQQTHVEIDEQGNMTPKYSSRWVKAKPRHTTGEQA